MLQTLSSEGITIFVSSHLLAEVTKLASRLGIIHNGKLKREIYMKDLRSEISQSLIIKVGDLARAQKVLYDAGYTFTMDDQLECLKSTDTVTIGSSKDVCATLVHAGLTPEEIYMEGEDLESYFLRQIT
jgi:ABC-2 type transport system ATP-binding protein